jgi:archaellum component FlaC
MPIRSFTNKKIRELNELFKKVTEEIRILSSKNEKDLWIADIEELEKA